MTPLQQSDLQFLIGKKVKVLMAGRFYYRVLHEDSQGLYIRYSKYRVPVKPDMNTLHILHFKALMPKGVK